MEWEGEALSAMKDGTSFIRLDMFVKEALVDFLTLYFFS